MIFLTRMDKQQMYINPDHIVSVEETPDTVITLFNGHHFIVRERAEVIIARIVAFRARVIRRAGVQTGRKYLARPKRSLFAEVTRDHEGSCPVGRDKQLHAPFHAQDL
ncbi:MAG: flagellar FlbD family protein [Deltaproteobacteria bacterium]|nr:flagellar FlbD family protein [Deltaproteobacteria bacterium]